MKAFLLVMGLLSGSFGALSQNLATISLKGSWSVALDLPNSSIQTIYLPGTLDDAGIGVPLDLNPKLDISTLGHLTRKVQYVGKAHYTRTVRIPADWSSKKITLRLGRVLWKSTIAIDGQAIPQTGESLVDAHSFDLTGKLIPGKEHRLTITVDNSNIYPGINIYAKQYASEQSSEMTHAYTNHTQIKWNGILGELLLTAQHTLAVKQVNIFPSLDKKELQIQYQINNAEGAAYQMKAYVRDPLTGKQWSRPVSLTTSAGQQLTATLPFAKKVSYWNEFNPRQYELVTILQSTAGVDTVITPFGVREIKAAGSVLQLNGHRVFMRGNLECIIFPKTGYPPMDVETWKNLFVKAKTYGLNSFRFHSWCPPAAAFQAADEVGFYLQVELPHWNLTVGEDTAAFHFLQREAHRILDAYGNHPSFLFMSMGNELEGNVAMLTALVKELKAKDPRHLYATTAFTFQKEITGIPQDGDEYYVTQWTKNGWVRGQGIFNDKAPAFSDDFRVATGDIKVPLISHEIGQYSVFPDMREIGKYTGNLVPVNFISVREDLKKKGLLALAPDYLKASGKLAALLYKEEVERALKTPEFDGFQLLQLQDFPGQGTALVGMLNAFWESKGFISAAEFRQFCSELTPLIRFPKAIYSNQEKFSATVELANFFQPLQKQELYWKLLDEKGNQLAGASLGRNNYPIGNCLPVGTIEADLSSITVASKLMVEVGVKGTAYRNSWPIWVYPSALAMETGNVVMASSVQEALRALNNGANVLLCPPPDTLRGIQGKFVPVFWSPVHFPDQPGTMGMLIKNQHPALAAFPTDNHTNWQWWDLAIKSKTMIVDGLPEEAFIVRVIDNFVRNQQLANVVELKMGKGKLLICSIDLQTDLTNRLPARQLKHSLLQYMNSAAFNPSASAETSFLQQLFK